MKRIISLALCLILILSITSIGSVSVGAAAQWLTMHTYESGWGSNANIEIGNTGFSGNLGGLTGTAPGNPNIEGSNNSIQYTGTGNLYDTNKYTVAKWIGFRTTNVVTEAADVRFSFFSSQAGYSYYGYKTNDGAYYWREVNLVEGWQWLYFEGETFYSNPGNTSLGIPNGGLSITVTARELDDMAMLLVTNPGGNNLVTRLDDVQYRLPGEGDDVIPRASFDLDNIADIESDADGNVTLPYATVAGKQFVGWKDAKDNLYKAGATVKLTDHTAFTAVTADIALQKGASIRWAKYERERGIRFETYVSKATLSAIGSNKFELGALILPYEDYDANITVNNSESYGAVNVVDPEVYGSVGDYYHYYSGVVDFEKYFEVKKAKLADLKLTAVSYIKVMYSGGASVYFYDHPDENENVRTVSQVARAALADGQTEYSEIQTEILKLYTKYSAFTPADDAVLATYSMTDLKDSTRLIGRGEYSGDNLLCDWTTSGFETGIIFQGELTVNFSLQGAEGMIGVIIDEDYDNMFTIRANSNTTSATIQPELKYEYHKVRVIKLNECDSNTNNVIFRGLTFAGELGVKPKDKDLKIEVIGDSITCGAGNIPTESSFGFFEDGSKTYAYHLAKKLDADLSVVARFGWGLAFNWGGDTNAVIPKIWDKTIPRSDSSKIWDFSKFEADLVLINLGTNDSSALNSGVSATADEIKQQALDFCNRIREKYPNSTIVWLEGMMGKYNTTYSSGVKAAIAELNNAYYCDTLPHGRGGINNHPNVAEHEAAGEALYTYLIGQGIITSD